MMSRMKGLTTEECLEMSTLYFGGSVFAINQPLHRDDASPVDPKLKFA